MCNQAPLTASGWKMLAFAHFIMGVLCFSVQIGLIVCVALQNGGFYLFNRNGLTPHYSTRNMARSSMGLFAGICYIAIGVVAYRLSQTVQGNMPQTAVSSQSQLLKVFRGLSIVGVVLSLLLFSFSVYLAYMMSIYWELLVNDWKIVPYLPSEALAPTCLHAIHAIFSLAQIYNCIYNTRVVLRAPQVTSSMAYQVQYPGQSVQFFQQQGYPQPYPAGNQQISKP